MTLQELYSLLYDYKPFILILMLLAPWLAWGICVAVPGKKEEPFVLSCNLIAATLSLLLALGYMWYAAATGGANKVVQNIDFLFVLAPCYYVGVSLWITRQRLPLAQVPAARAIQGLALIGAAYLGLAWFFSKLRIVLFSFLPAQFLLLILLGFVSIAYMGYQRVTGADFNPASSRQSSDSESSPFSTTENNIEDELEALRRDLNNEP